MSVAKPVRLTATSMVLAAAILALVCLLPSLSRPAPVSAQSCPYGTSILNGCGAVGGCSQFVFGYNCSGNCAGSSVGCYNNGSCQAGLYSNGAGCYQANSGNCANGFTYTVTGCSIYNVGNCPAGTVYNGLQCTSSGACPVGYSYSTTNCANTGNCPLGSTYTSAGCIRSGTPSTSSTSCASAGFSVASTGRQVCSSSSVGSSIGSNGAAGGGCAGKVLQTGQTCSNGVVSGAATCPNGQAISQGGVCAVAASNTAINANVSCTADGLLPVFEACTTANSTTNASTNASASANQCAGLTLSSGQTCSNGIVTCANGQIVAAGQPCPGDSTTNTNSSIGSTSGGVSVTYSGGWNLVAAPGGTSVSGAGGSLYTLQAGDLDYETIQAGATVKSGQGYWAYFGSSVTDNVPQTSAGTVTVTLPAGTSVMIGNSGSSMATVSGADSVLVFDPVSGAYSQTTTLRPGQGAWASSVNGGQATITNQ